MSRARVPRARISGFVNCRGKVTDVGLSGTGSWCRVRGALRGRQAAGGREGDREQEADVRYFGARARETIRLFVGGCSTVNGGIGRASATDVKTNVLTDVWTTGMLEEQLAISGFDWDAGNRAKCERHGVSCADIEGILARTLSARFMHRQEIKRYEQENPDLQDG